MRSSTPSASAPGAGGSALLYRWTGVLAPVALLALLAAHRWTQMGDYPTGIDPGNWFAFGKQLFGDGGKSTASAYPPLIPLLMHLGRAVADPMVVAKVAAVGSLLAVVLAVYVVARTAMIPWFALAAAAFVALSSVINEAVAFGGYAQNVAFAFLLVAAWLEAKYLETGRLRFGAGAAAALAATAATHHVYFLLACVVLAAVWLAWITERPQLRIVAVRSLYSLGFVGFAALWFLPTLLALREFGYMPPVNANAVNIEAALRQAFAGLSWPAAAVSVGGLAYLVIAIRRRQEAAWKVAAGLCAVSLVALAATGEPRLIPLFIGGTTLAAGLALQRIWELTRDRSWGGVALAVPVVALAVAWPFADARAAEQYRFYAVADEPLQVAAAWIQEHHGDGLVVTRHDRFGWPVGWWFEGLTDADIAVGSNVKWLGFPDERERALLAERFFEQGMSGHAVTELAAETGVDLLVFRKWEWIGWERWLSEPSPAVSVAFDDGEFMILDVRDHS